MDKELMVSWIEAGIIQIPYLLIQKYREIGLDEKELVLLLHILSFAEKGNEFPTPEQISERMTITSSECSSVLRRLVQLEMIKIEEGSSEEIRFEKYSLTPLWMKLVNEMIQEKKQLDIKNIFLEEQDIYSTFEKEFGRPLSPIECESLAMWIDQDGQDPVIIKAALREAVMSGKVNFRYIDRILFEWKKNGIQTLEQARVHSLKFRQKSRQPVNQTSATSNAVPFYNWLEQ
ncbi:DnaD domain-containing protein [Lederbergia citrea]|uniref:DnaD domain-containing protein n=1 Tax=Lederbergia citrea TaxID=2833581 RepID=A0A942UNW4_9BACI|nr:DnaD domain-containing protein [Lederbergia citrea]MBS4176594.1 DnaD domain-containing protein [Lederbergia citrea]MBS4203155.1 DnaD domain-containing protein [Lederbergia citrea]MBS4222173.1 DnaD domain-containing protein [Lederbergia citrea]